MSRIISIIGYCVCAVFGLMLVIESRRDPDKITPLSELLDRVLTTRAARITIFVFWWWLGWHFLFAQTV